MKFSLRSPCFISSRLLPAVMVGNSTISIEYGRITTDCRQIFTFYLDTPKFSFRCDEVHSGVGGSSLQDGLANVLGFLCACGEGKAYESRTGRKSENSDLFLPHVGEWAEGNLNELSMLVDILEEEGGVFIEELD